ncbi:MAG: YhjD/YihY/BrkB family envelope integrity protein, partial [Pirellulales bacterium]
MKTLKKAISEFSEDRCMQMAAALAFYTMLSLAPLLVLVVTIASLVMGPQAKQTFTRQASNLVGPQGAEELEELLDRGQSQQGAGAEAQGSGQSQPSADQPSGDQPSADQPSADQPSADQPSADQP